MTLDEARRRTRRIWPAAFALAAALMTGCQTVGFYSQAIHGECQILARRKPVATLISNPHTPDALKRRLQLVERLRAFAKDELRLPVDHQYSKYTDLHRRYVVWNVQAAPRFSLQAVTWWYPLVGRLEYRGYFSEPAARACAARLQARGFDVDVDGVAAFSTLGWFKDPVLNTFVDEPEPELAELLFHELAHQRVFAPGDTDFNEAFATTVGQEGARRWLRAEGKTALHHKYVRALRRNAQFVALIMSGRARLEKIYGDTVGKGGRVKAAKTPPAPPVRLLREKREAYAELRRQYAALKSRWGGYSGYDRWFAHDLNNAKLNSVATYFQYLPGFKRLLRLDGGDLAKFYESAARLAKMPKRKRHRWLRQLAKRGSRAAVPWSRSPVLAPIRSRQTAVLRVPICGAR